MKKIMSILLILSMFFMTITAFASEETPNTDFQSDNSLSIVLKIGSNKMLVNGTETEIDPGRGTVPITQNGRTLMPVRAIVEEIGGKVEWNEQEQAAILTCGDNAIVLYIGSKEALLNKEKNILDCEPVVINGRTMLPIRFVAESFGYTVAWNGDEQEITIVKPSDNAEVETNTIQTLSDGTKIQKDDPSMPTRIIENGTKIDMHFVDTRTGEDTIIPGTLNDCETAKALIEQLPYTVHVSRYSHDFCGVIQELPYNEDEVHNGWLNGDIDYAIDAPYFTILFDDEENSEQFGYQVNIGVIDCPIEKISSLTGSYDVRIELSAN